MEPHLGADLTKVQVHTSGESATAAEKLGARAFTTGSEIHFGAGEFAPGTKEGDRLIAHELTHAVQAQKSGIQRKPTEAKGGDEEHGDHAVSQPGEPAEQEADAVADHVTDKLHDDKGAAGKDAPKAAGIEQAPKIGAKLQSGAISLTKKGDKQDAPKPRLGNPGGVQPVPDTLAGFPGAQRTKAKTSVQGGGGMRARWLLPDGSILEWDSRHGAVEKYNKRGNHVGEFDPNTGAQTKPADKTRKVDP